MKVLEFDNLKEGILIERPNRFLAKVKCDGNIKNIHIHDPGRLPLLKYGTKILFLPKRSNRKTEGHLIAFYSKPYGWVFSHSGYHSTIVERLLNLIFPDVVKYEKEVKIDNHRIDFKIVTREKEFLLEVNRLHTNYFLDFS